MERSDFPLISCVMPTFLGRRCRIPDQVQLFLDQDYPNKELIIVADYTDIFDFGNVPVNQFYLSGQNTIGAKRNFAIARSRGNIIAHWDDDDWCRFDRLRCQYLDLCSFSADLVGYYQLKFQEEGTNRNWEYTGKAVGASFMYRKELWRKVQFPEINVGEDANFLMAAQTLGKVQETICQGQMVCSIHPGNTSVRDLNGKCWRPIL